MLQKSLTSEKHLSNKRIKLFLNKIDTIRKDANHLLDTIYKEQNGQYFSNVKIAEIMASLFKLDRKKYSILDPGAGVGILSAVFLACMFKKKIYPEEISLTLIENDTKLIPSLQRTMEECMVLSQEANVKFFYKIIISDFIKLGTDLIINKTNLQKYNYVIMNPPYKKLSIEDNSRKLLQRINFNSANLYTGFVSLSLRMLQEKGQLVAITPRSFCNGPYFQSFRKDLLEKVSFTKIHTFDSRKAAFQEDSVLQENIIFHVQKTRRKARSVNITSNSGPDDKQLLRYKVDINQLVHPWDSEQFIRIVKNDFDIQYVNQMHSLEFSLKDLEIDISTGKVVDFRNLEYLRQDPVELSCPLIYPCHVINRKVCWPLKNSSKPNAIINSEQTDSQLLPNELFVIVKRFTTKEEQKRVVAAIYNPLEFPDIEKVAFENRINYFHFNNRGFSSLTIALGLSTYLNSTLVDNYFRQFNGHTQVNVADLKSIKYPSITQLQRIGTMASVNNSQEEIDEIISTVLFGHQEV